MKTETLKNASTFLKMYQDVWAGALVTPRGSPIREAENYQLTIDMDGSPCTSFLERKFNLRYAKDEFLWYLKGDRYDVSIEKKAGIWPKIKQPEGYFYSNYGHYIFGQSQRQFDWVVEELRRDKDSRRASIVLINREHFFRENNDVVCTYGINFRIRNDRLNMSVSMRSNDAIFGFTNDVFSFSVLYRLVYAALRATGYVDLMPGNYVHKADSLHVYERHWDMIKKIIGGGLDQFEPIEVPYCTGGMDLMGLLSVRLFGHYTDTPKEECALSHFLYT